MVRLLLKKKPFGRDISSYFRVKGCREGHIFLSPRKRAILHHFTMFITSLFSVEIGPTNETFVSNTRRLTISRNPVVLSVQVTSSERFETEI